MRYVKKILIALMAGFILLTALAFAEETNWQADISALTDMALLPKTIKVQMDQNSPETAEKKDFTYQLVSSNGDMLKIDLDIAVDGITLRDEQWNVVTQWLKDQINASVQNISADASSIAHSVAEGLESARAAVQPDATGMVPLYAHEGVLLRSVTVTLPYYQDLSTGSNNDATLQLQQKLIRLGYLRDAADGVYGGNTKKAVEELEEYIRLLEQDAINLRLKEEANAPEDPQGETWQPVEQTVFGDVEVLKEDTTYEYKKANPKYLPMTMVDGIAEGELQVFFLNENFPAGRRTLDSSTNGNDVKRLQYRLTDLGYLSDTPDGYYGDNTMRAVLVFQYFNNLQQTGSADVDTQQKIFAENAQKPDNSLLKFGSEGEEVKKLQKRLRTAGFGSVGMDGAYGESTQSAVERLQEYMRDLEEKQLKAAHPGEDISTMQTIAVNGIADPILLKDFYSDSFPMIPEPLSTGGGELDVKRVQRRLSTLDYYYDGIDGSNGDETKKSIKLFQQENGLSADGIAGSETMRTLFNENAKRCVKPYVLKVSIEDQRVYVYMFNNTTQDYDVLYKTFVCSTGRDSTPTPKGTFQSGTGPRGGEWHYFTKWKCWAKYIFTISGDILFHSVLFSSNTSTHPTNSSVRHLGRKASHGCVRLAVEDAKWIHDNCPRNTKVIVY